jgi:hypothetical protein
MSLAEILRDHGAIQQGHLVVSEYMPDSLMIVTERACVTPLALMSVYRRQLSHRHPNGLLRGAGAVSRQTLARSIREIDPSTVRGAAVSSTVAARVAPRQSSNSVRSVLGVSVIMIPFSSSSRRFAARDGFVPDISRGRETPGVNFVNLLETFRALCRVF